jgi:hypothetical protein
VRLSRAPARTGASLDDPQPVSRAGLVPVMAVAERAGPGDLGAEHARPGGDRGANPVPARAARHGRGRITLHLPRTAFTAAIAHQATAGKECRGPPGTRLPSMSGGTGTARLA